MPVSVPNAVPTDASSNAPVPAPGTPSATTPVKGEKVAIKTDILGVDLNTLGASVDRVELLAYRDSADPKQNFVLLDQTPGYFYVAQTGLVGSSGAASLPTHRSTFTVVPGPRTLEPGQDTLTVAFESESGGVKLVKTYTFRRGSYQIEVKHAVTNTGTAPVAPQLYLQLVRDDKAPAGGSHFYSTYYGPAVYSDAQRFQKVSFDDITKGKGPEKHVLRADDGWVAMLQHYFVSAWVPAAGPRDYYTDKLDANLYRAGMREPLGSIAPGATQTSDARLFVGPAEERLLETVAPGLELVRDYGWDHDPRQADVLGAREDPRRDRQLGLGDHRAHDPDQARVLPAVGRELQVDGADEERRAADEGTAGPPQGRSRQAQPGNDGAVQDREDQSDGRLPADRDPDPVLHRALFDPARIGRDARRAVAGLDPGPGRARSLVHPAGDHDGVDVRAVQTEPRRRPIPRRPRS